MLTYNVQANDTINSNPTLELKNKREKGIDSQTVYMPESEMQKIRHFFTKWEKEVGEKEARQEGFKILSKSTAIQIGTNKILYPDDGKVYLSDQSPRTIGQHGGNWLDCRTEYIAPFASGSGEAWGWIGEYIQISGSGSRNCNIVFSGRYKGQLEAVEFNNIPIDTSAYASLYLQIYDVTNGNFSKVAETKVFERGITFTVVPNDVQGIIGTSQSLNCRLYAGKTYLVRAKLSTKAEASMHVLNTDKKLWGRSDFADAPMTSYGEGLDISHIKIIWN